MRVKRQAVALAAVVLLTLTGCDAVTGPDRPRDEQTLGQAGEAGSAKNADAKAPVKVPKDAARGGTLTVLTREVPATFDPTQAYYTDSTAILSGLVTRSLTQYVYDEKSDSMVLVPDMATDLGRPNRDNTEWTFTLREGLTYEDGTEVRAEDVAYAIKRSFAIEELPDGPTYQTTYFLGGEDYRGPFQDRGDYAGVEVNGNHITIKMRRPFADMDYYASFPAFTAIPEGKDDPARYGEHPVATGPYKFVDYQPGSSLTLERNEHWDADTDPGRLQLVDRWEFKFGEDSVRVEDAIITDKGAARTSLTYDNVTPAGYQAIQQQPERLVTGTAPCTHMWFLDMEQIPDKRVRRALGYAFPYQEYWRAGGEVEGVTRVPSTSILPPGTAGRVEYDALSIGGVDTDPEKARQLLAEAGAEGFEVKFLFASDDALSVAAKSAIVEGLELAGFTATPVPSTTLTLRTDRTDYDAPINVRASAWCSDWPSGGSWFPSQWHGDLVGLEGMPNQSNFDQDDADQEQNRILDRLAPDEAVEAWGRFDRMIMEKYYPAITLGYTGTAMVHGSKVGGMANDNVRGMPTYGRMYVTAGRDR